MFFKLATVFALVAATLASPTPGSSTCSTGTLQCCDSIAPSSSTNSGTLAGLIPIALQGLNVPIGVNCIPITALGLGSSGTCSAQAACCDGVSNTGTVPIGLDCSPVNVGL